MKTLLVLNDPPYGTERCYNARLAGALAKQESQELRVFLMGDAVACAKNDQIVAEGYYNLNRMLKVITIRQAPVGVCGSCLDARGIAPGELIPGAQRSSIDELADWMQWADKVIVF